MVFFTYGVNIYRLMSIIGILSHVLENWMTQKCDAVGVIVTDQSITDFFSKEFHFDDHIYDRGSTCSLSFEFLSLFRNSRDTNNLLLLDFFHAYK